MPIQKQIPPRNSTTFAMVICAIVIGFFIVFYSVYDFDRRSTTWRALLQDKKKSWWIIIALLLLLLLLVLTHCTFSSISATSVCILALSAVYYYYIDTVIVCGCCDRGEDHNRDRGGGEQPEQPKTCCKRVILTILKWSVSIFVQVLVLLIAIIKIGAARQMTAVSDQLLSTPLQVMHPPDNKDFNTGPVCAWSNPTSSSSDSIIQTFATAQDAHNANFNIIHCGECGACSNWNDLRILWTTRSNLASMAQECTKKSLIGTFNDVHKCNMDIGFTNDCALCWTVDELCAKKNCVFIFLRSVLMNNIGNFNVGLEHIITGATCDEAMCGPEFASCSGATRRRMNIVSEIPRPKNQQCHIIDQDWASVFNHP